MPQFDPGSFSSQLFWLFLSIAPLYWMLSKVFVPKIQSLINERHQKIEGTLEQANLLDQEIHIFLEERDQILKDARTGAALILRDALEKINQYTKEQHTLLEDSLSDRIWDTETELLKEYKELHQELPKLGLDATRQILSRLIPNLPSDELARDVVHSLAPDFKEAA
jgi:F-type H+-transporting ATPase subunit b